MFSNTDTTSVGPSCNYCPLMTGCLNGHHYSVQARGPADVCGLSTSQHVASEGVRTCLARRPGSGGVSKPVLSPSLAAEFPVLKMARCVEVAACVRMCKTKHFFERAAAVERFFCGCLLPYQARPSGRASGEERLHVLFGAKTRQLFSGFLESA